HEGTSVDRPFEDGEVLADGVGVEPTAPSLHQAGHGPHPPPIVMVSPARPPVADRPDQYRHVRDRPPWDRPPRRALGGSPRTPFPPVRVPARVPPTSRSGPPSSHARGRARCSSGSAG